MLLRFLCGYRLKAWSSQLHYVTSKTINTNTICIDSLWLRLILCNSGNWYGNFSDVILNINIACKYLCHFWS